MQNEVHLIEIWDAIFLKKLYIVFSTGIFAIGSIFYSLSLPNMYESTALLAPVKENNPSGGLGQFSSLGALAGLNLSATQDNSVNVAIRVMTSRKFATKIIIEHNLLPDLLAVESWNEETRELGYIQDRYDHSKNIYVNTPGSDDETSMWLGIKKFSAQLVVDQDLSDGFVVVTVRHQSPDVAKKWVDLIVAGVNEVMRLKDIEEAQKSMTYLSEKLDTIVLKDMKEVFYQLVEQQMKTIMLAEVRDEYVFTTIDPAVVAKERSSPNRSIICILATAFGAGIGGMFVLGQFLIQRSRTFFE